MPVVEEYESAAGRSPFGEWFAALPPQAAAKVQRCATKLELGLWPNVKSVGKGVHEARIDFDPGYRVYFGIDGDTLILLLGGGDKKTQQGDIAAAQRPGLNSNDERKRKDIAMALTRSFRATVVARAQSDPAFRAAMIEEIWQAYADGEDEEARIMLRDCVNATVGFAKLGEITHISTKSLMRMLSARGNPSMGNLSSILQAVQREAGVHTRVAVELAEPVAA